MAQEFNRRVQRAKVASLWEWQQAAVATHKAWVSTMPSWAVRGIYVSPRGRTWKTFKTTADPVAFTAEEAKAHTAAV
eukprot:3422591-Lingulodinium_polyedra.AAC.1